MYRKNLPFDLTAVECAKDCIGLHEGPGNTGHAINLIQRSASIPSGSPWCAAFVNWCAEYASVVHNKKSPLEDVPFQGYVQSYYAWAKRCDLIVPDPFPGALFLRYSQSQNRHNHMGFVYLGPRYTRFNTIEGNTNLDGHREGTSVLIRERDRATGTYTFVDWTKGMTNER